MPQNLLCRANASLWLLVFLEKWACCLCLGASCPPDWSFHRMKYWTEVNYSFNRTGYLGGIAKIRWKNLMSSWLKKKKKKSKVLHIYLHTNLLMIVGSPQSGWSGYHLGMSSTLPQYCSWSSPYETSCYKM